MQLHTNSSSLFNVLRALVYRYFRKTSSHLDFPETAWELSSQCCDAHRTLLTCIYLRWTSFIVGFLSTGLLLFTSPHTACLPNQSIPSLITGHTLPSLVPAYSFPHKVGQPVGKDAFFFFFCLNGSYLFHAILNQVPMITKPSWLKSAVQTMVDMQDLSTPLPFAGKSKKTMRTPRPWLTLPEPYSHFSYCHGLPSSTLCANMEKWQRAHVWGTDKLW